MQTIQAIKDKTMPRTVINCTTGEVTEVVVDDTYITTHRQNQIKITIVDTAKLVGETESVSLQLVTHPLTDGVTQNNVLSAETVTMQFGDVIQDVTLNASGTWTDTLEFTEAGNYTVQCLSLVSNAIIVGVT